MDALCVWYTEGSNCEQTLYFGLWKFYYDFWFFGFLRMKLRTMQGLIEKYLKFTRGTQSEAITEPRPLVCLAKYYIYAKCAIVKTIL